MKKNLSPFLSMSRGQVFLKFDKEVSMDCIKHRKSWINKMRIWLLIVITVIINVNAFPSNQAVIVHNSIQDIDACKGNLVLKLVLVWGGSGRR